MVAQSFPKFFGECADFVGKNDFQRMPQVTNILHHLCKMKRRFEKSPFGPGVESSYECRVPRLRRADDRHRRFQDRRRKAFTADFEPIAKIVSEPYIAKLECIEHSIQTGHC
jgi:hypothetical protein